MEGLGKEGFSITKEDLVEIVSTCQNRTFAEQVQLLQKKDKNIHWLFESLITDQKNGINPITIEERKLKFGTNEKYIKQPAGICQLLWNALEDFTLRILIVASIVSIAIEVGTAEGDKKKLAWIQGFAVMCAVMISASVTAINDYQKQRQFQQLNNIADKRKKVTLKRLGVLQQLHQDKTLVGDIVTICQGMEIPADGILIQSNEITIDESAMTGQTDPVGKNILQECLKKKEQIQKNGERNTSGKHDVPSPIIMSGTRVLTGQGKMMILVVGDLSCLGKIRKLLDQQQATATPLQMKLETIAQDIGKFGLISAIIILIVLLIRFAIQRGIERQFEAGKHLPQILNFIILAITVVVVAIPEGLPLAVTLSLAFSVKQMLDDNNLVRKLQACETMGGANNICSDKTGTLTLNKMTLTTIWNGTKKQIDTYKLSAKLEEYIPNTEFVQLFKISIYINSTALLRPQVKGSSTQIALLNFLETTNSNSFQYQVYRQKYPTKLKYPFSSARKRMSVIIQYKNNNILLVKGASQMILASCKQWFNMNTGQIETITQAKQQEMNKNIINMAQNSLRTLCIAYKKLRATQNLQTKDEKGVFSVQKNDLVLLAILGVKDIHRPQVPEAIRLCNIAGIKVRMVTGDNLITAKAIAKEVGIIKDGDGSISMEGSQFIKRIGGVVCKKCQTAICGCAKDSKQAKQQGTQVRVDTIQNGKQFDDIIINLSVLARSRPQDKYALVTGLKQRGQVVAVTGDGTNDAPALKKADVGFAMGQAGTEVARQAAAIILLDDNFNSIVKAVLWGRNIYDCIRKFIQFQLTVNVVAVFTTLIGAALIKQSVLKPIQMLWVNLIMDTLASLALATQPPTQQLLHRKPHSRDQYIISRTMFKHIIGQSIYQIIIIIVLLFAGEMIIPEFPGAYDHTIFMGKLQYKYNIPHMSSFQQNMPPMGATVRSGRFKFIDGSFDYEHIYDETHIFSRHFTFIFNAFVMMQIFNFLNCRKLHEQLNIFSGICSNKMFLGIVVLIIALQIILITFGGIAFGVYADYGLHILQWLICTAIGSVSILINFLLKIVFKNHDPPIQMGQKQLDPSTKKKRTISLKNIQHRMERDIAKNIRN